MDESYGQPRREVSFGDIFDAAFLFDVHLRDDAVQLGARTVAPKYGGGLAFAASHSDNRHYVLGRGAPHRALLITDNCEVDTALAQRGEQDREADQESKPKGRLLFAPIAAAQADDEGTPSFGRFWLPPCDQVFPAQVVELRRCFMVDSRDIAQHKDSRVVRLSDPLAEDLEVRWNAFAARRGPLADIRNADKLVGLLARAGGREEPTQEEVEAGQALADALVASWRVEGGELEQAADAFDRGADASGVLDALEEGLASLASLAERSVSSLRAARGAI